MRSKLQRIWELDYFRGLAIILMIIFHLLWDLNLFHIIKLNFEGLLIHSFQIMIAVSFLTIAGICLFISYKQNLNKKTNHIKPFLFRGLKISFFALIISAITFFFLGKNFILFGILHLIAFSVLLSIIFVRFGKWNYIVGILFIILGFLVDKIFVNNTFLVIFGFKNYSFGSVDYYPIFPWTGFVLIGLGLGITFYSSLKSRIKLDLPLVSIISFLGKNSLLIYFLHQPIILCIFYFLGYKL